jgi:hypothetical protein
MYMVELPMSFAKLMSTEFRQRFMVRIFVAGVFSLVHGFSTVASDAGLSSYSIIGGLVGWVVGILIASWWALAVAPVGFTLGLVIAYLIDVTVVPFVWSEWAVNVVLSLVFVVPGVYIGRWASGPPQRAGAGDTG